MKKFFVFLVLIFTIMINIYLIFYWQPQEKNVVEEKDSKEVMSFTKGLYRVDKDKILRNLSSKDRNDLEKIIKKLSTFDLGKIKEYINDSNDEEDIVDIFMILKKRLTENDYKRIEEITSPYLYIDNINEKIKKRK